MKSSTFFAGVFVVMLFSSASMQTYAQVSDAVYHERLYYLCKSWGHAKYYHTEIAKGLVNWDNELLTAVSAARNAPDNATFNEALLQMLNNAGVMQSSTVPLPTVPDSLNNNLDKSWIQNPFFSAAVRAKLETITTLFRPQSNVYVGLATSPTFLGDSASYHGPDYPVEALRMLSLFRYWNIINYFYPYKNIMDQAWDATLAEFIPKMANASDAISYNLVCMELATRINDSHAQISSPVFVDWIGQYYPPFSARFIENQVVITKVLPGTAGIAVGDVITAIDGSDIATLRTNFMKYVPGSNDAAKERNFIGMLRNGDAGDFTMTVSNATGTNTVTLQRNSTNKDALAANTSPVWYQTTLQDGSVYGVVDMGRLVVADVPAMFADLWNTSAIVFDQRNFPKSTLWTIVNYLYPGPINIAKFTVPDITYPGRLSWHDEIIGSGTANPYQGKVIVLFDERTQSQAEYTVMGLEQFPCAKKIGSTTAGADGNVSYIHLPGNIVSVITGLGTFYPDYTPTQRVGIIPDIVVNPTIAGIRNGLDEVLTAALGSNLFSGCYCNAYGKSVASEWISQVKLGTFTKTSGSNGGYADFTSPAIAVTSGSAYSFLLTAAYNGKARTEYCRAWVDYNNDGDFTDAGETAFSANAFKTSASGSIAIPSGLTGNFRMRVSMKYNAAPTPCELFANGEVEDYTLSITAPVTAAYCTSRSNSCSLEWIAGVRIGTFTKTSGASTFSDFTSTIVSLSPGSAYPITLTPAFSGSARYEYWRVWIDFNGDGDFTDSGEQVFAPGRSKSAVTGTLSIPAGKSGQTRMRISMKYNAAPTSCEVFSYGEVEDYTVSFGSAKNLATGSAHEILLYPNPASTLLNLELPGNTAEMNVMIFNSTGAMVAQFVMNDTQKQIDLQAYPAGLYFVRVQGGGKLFRKSFVRD